MHLFSARNKRTTNALVDYDDDDDDDDDERGQKQWSEQQKIVSVQKCFELFTVGVFTRDALALQTGPWLIRQNAAPWAVV